MAAASAFGISPGIKGRRWRTLLTELGIHPSRIPARGSWGFHDWGGGLAL